MDSEFKALDEICRRLPPSLSIKVDTDMAGLSYRLVINKDANEFIKDCILNPTKAFCDMVVEIFSKNGLVVSFNNTRSIFWVGGRR